MEPVRRRQEERDAGDGPDAGEDAQHGPEEHAGEAVEEVLPLERDREALADALEIGRASCRERV